MSYEESEEETLRFLQGSNEKGKRTPVKILGDRAAYRAAVTRGEVPLVHVVVEAEERLYGGREEGGWWYNRRWNEKVWRCRGFRQILARVREGMDEFVPPRFDIYSCANRGEAQYTIYLCLTAEDIPEENLEHQRYE